MDTDTFREEINTNDDRALATESYRAAWEIFYNWESLYSRRSIEGNAFVAWMTYSASIWVARHQSRPYLAQAVATVHPAVGSLG
jgi:hypothetical protein